LGLDQAPDKGSGLSLASGVFACDGIERTAPVHCIATDPRLAGYGAPASQTVAGNAAAAVPRRTSVRRERVIRGAFSWIGEYCDARSMATVRGRLSVGDPMKRRSTDGNFPLRPDSRSSTGLTNETFTPDCGRWPRRCQQRPSQKKTPNASVDPERNTRPKQLKGANRCKGVVLHTDGDAAAPPPDLALGLIGKARSVRGSFDFRSFR
jgi:hypothetical protein